MGKCLDFEIFEELIEDRTFMGLLYQIVYKKPRTKKVYMGFKYKQGEHILFHVSRNLPVKLVWNAVQFDSFGRPEHYLRNMLKKHCGVKSKFELRTHLATHAKSDQEIVEYVINKEGRHR